MMRVLLVLLVLLPTLNFSQVDSLSALKTGITFLNQNISEDKCLDVEGSQRLKGACLAKQKLEALILLDKEIDSLYLAVKELDDIYFSTKSSWIKTADSDLNLMVSRSKLTRTGLLNHELDCAIILFENRKQLLLEIIKHSK